MTRISRDSIVRGLGGLLGRCVVAATVAAFLCSSATPASAQITVGGNGGDTVDSTTYSGTQGLTKIGTNAVALTGNNSYSGGTVVNDGVLQLPADTALGASGGGVTLNGGQLGLYGNDLTLGSGRVITLGTAGGFLSAGWNKSFSVAGPIGGSGGLGIAWEAGVVFLNGSNSYAGTTTIGTTGKYSANANATLRLGNANALPAGTPLVFGASAHTATLDVQGFSANVGSLTGSGNARITNGGAGTPTVTVTVASGTATYAGQINGNVAVTKSGAGAQVLSGTNSYSGATTVSGGLLQLGAGTSDTVSSSSGYAINNGSTLGVGGTRFDFNTSGGSARTITFGTSGGNTLDTGSGVNIVDWVGNTYRTTGGARNVITGSSGLNIAPGATAALDVARGTDATSDLTISARFWNSGAITKTGSGILTVTGSLENTGGTTISAGTLRVGDGGTTGSLGSGGITNNAALIVNRSNAVTFGQAISGSGSLTQAGPGTTTLTGGNSYSGGTTISSGTLQMGDGGTTGAIGTGGVVNNAAFVFNRSDSFTVANVFSGSGSVAKNGSGTVTLSGNNSFSGGTTVNAGTLGGSTGVAFDGTQGGAFGTGSIMVNSGATIRTNSTFTLGGGNQTTRTVNLLGGTANITGAGTGGEYLRTINLQAGTITADNGSEYFRSPTGGFQINSLASATSSTIGTGIDLTFSSLVADTAAGTVPTGADLVISGNITENTGVTGEPAKSLTKNGAGTLVLSGNNSYSGGTVINTGTLRVGNGGSSGSLGSGNVANNAALVFDRAGTLSAANVVSGSGTVTKNGSGTVTLSGSNSYSGGTTVNAGTLTGSVGVPSGSSQGGSFGTGSITVNSGATIRTGSTFVLGGGNQTTRTVNLLGGTANITGAGAGGEYLRTINLQAGTITADDGSVYFRSPTGGFQINSLASATSSTIGTGIDLTLSNLVVNTAAGTVPNGADLVISGNITENTGVTGEPAKSLTKNGAGTLVLSASNSYTGGTFINEGVVRAGNAFALGSRNAAATTVTVAAGATLDINRVTGNTGDFFYGVTIAGVGAAGQGALINTGTDGNTSNHQTPNITLSANARIGGSGSILMINTNYAATSLDLAGNTLTKVGTNAFILANTTVSAGVIDIQQGTLSQFNTGANASAAAITLANVGGVALTLNDLDMSVGSLAGGGATGGNVSLGSGRLTVGGRNENTSFGGVIAGTGGVIKVGTGTQALTGANTYSGTTTISAGTLQVGNGGTTGALGSGAVVTNATLAFNRSNAVTVANAILGSGTLVQRGLGTTTLTAQTTHTGGTIVEVGTLLLSGSNRLAPAGAATVNAGGTLRLNGDQTLASIAGSGAITFGTSAMGYTLTTGSVSSTFAGNISGPGSLKKAGPGTLLLTGSNSYTSTTLVLGGTLATGGDNVLPTAGNLTVNAGGTLLLGGNQEIRSVSGSGVYDLNGYTLRMTGGAAAFDGDATGGGVLQKDGFGIWSLRGTTSGSTAVVLNGGSIKLMGNNRLSDSGAVTVNNGTFDMNGFTDVAGSVTVNGGKIVNGTLQAAGVTMDDGRVSGVLTGTGGFTKTSAGTVVISSTSSYTGETAIQGGALETTGANQLAANSTMNISAGGTFKMGGSQTLASVVGSGVIDLGNGTLTTGSQSSTFAGSLTGNGGLTKVGPGTLTLTGSNAFDGDTTLSGGTLVLASPNALPTDAIVTMQAGATLQLSGTTVVGAIDQGSGTVTGGVLVASLIATTSGAIDSTIADGEVNGTPFAAGILKRGAGTTTIGAANTFTGAIRLQGGMLQLTGSGGFDPASRLVMSSGATMDLNGKSQTFSALTGTGGTVALGSGQLTVNNAAGGVFAGVISGSGGVVKTGAGLLELTGASTYTGATAINAGELKLNGSLASSALALAAGATLSGTGSISGNAVIAGIHMPGNSPGIQSVGGDLTYSAGSSVTWELTANTAALGDRGVEFDGINVGGNLAFLGTAALNLAFNGSGSLVNWNDAFWETDKAGANGWLIYDTAGTTSSLSGLAINGTDWLDGAGNSLLAIRPDASFALQQVGSDVYLTFVAVPEPSSIVLVGCTLAGLALARRRRQDGLKPACPSIDIQ